MVGIKVCRVIDFICYEIEKLSLIYWKSVKGVSLLCALCEVHLLEGTQWWQLKRACHIPFILFTYFIRILSCIIGRWRHPRLDHLLLVACQSRIYFQQYFILPVFPTISGILPPPIFMKLYIQLSCEKAAARKRWWITHKLTSKFKTASHAESVQSADFGQSIRHVVQASVSYHISRLSFVLCNFHHQTKMHIHRFVYRECEQSSQEYCWTLKRNVFCANKLWETRQTILDDRSYKHWRWESEGGSLVVPSALLVCLAALGAQSACLGKE